MQAPEKTRKTMYRRSRACENCHNRKVKCVLEAPATTCDNCVLDEIPCRFTKSRRGRKSRQIMTPQSPIHDGGEGQERQGHTLGSLIAQHTPTWLEKVHEGPASRAKGAVFETDLTASPGSQAQYVSPASEETLHRELSYASLIQRAAFGVRVQSHSHSTESEAHGLSPTATVAHAVHCSGCNCEVRASELPSFVNPIPSNMDGQDICFLRRKGALDVPDLPLRSALIRAYIEHLHPWMPFLDLEMVYGAVQVEPALDKPRISILLLQALMFAASASVDMSELTNIGFISRRDARKAYFERLRLLYEFNVEKDRLVVLQAVLLMTLWADHADDEKGCWHWMGVAHTLALSLGLHRAGTSPPNDAKAYRQRRRLWWSCFIRDRQFVQSMSRPSRIHPDDFDTPMLTYEDFEHIVRPPDLSDHEFQYIAVGDVDHQRQLAEFCTRLAEHSVHVGAVFALHFSMVPPTQHPKPTSVTGPTSTPMLYPKPNPEAETIWTLDQKLRQWLQTLPPSCVYEQSGLQTRNSSSLMICRGFLRAAYFSLVSTLHRPRGMTASGVPSLLDTYVRSQLSKERLRSAAVEITSITHHLHHLGLLTRAPQSFAMFQLSAVFSHVQQLGAADAATRGEIIQQLFHTLEAAEALQEVNSGADVPASIITHLLSKVHVHVLRDQKGHPRAMRFKGRLYILDESSAVVVTPLQPHFADEDATAPPKHQSCEEEGAGLTPSNPSGNDWGLSGLDTMPFSLSPFTADFADTADDGFWTSEDLAFSFDAADFAAF